MKRVIAPLIAVLAGVLLAGCVGDATSSPATQSPGPTPSRPIPSAERDVPTPAPEPTFAPGAPAADNRDYFRHVLDRYAMANGMGTSEALVAALVAAGFDRGLVEVTSETTAIGLAASAIDVAVRIDSECLLASIRTESVIVDIAPVLGNGRCLIGAVDPIQ